MRKVVWAAMCLFAVLLVPTTTAWAQVQTGSILVKSIDESGAVVPGVTATISSPVLVSGTQTGVTDAGGAYRFVALPPGTYTVKVELSGFQGVTREGVTVGAGSTTPIEFTMKVGNLSETLVVKGESPIIDTTNANVNVHLDAKLLDTTPAGRDIWSIVEYKVPGLVMATPDVGGNQGGLQRGITARGTGNGQNTQTLNGVNVGDPAAIGFAGYYYDPSSFQDIQVSSGANDITVPSGGVLINMVTKSGTNRFSGQVLDTYQGKNTQAENIDSTLQAEGVRPGSTAVDHIKNFNVNAGGPILKNKLFYFAALNDQRTAVHFAGFPSPAWTGAPEPDTTNITSIFANPTYQVSNRNRVQATVSRQVYDKINRGADTSNGTQDPQSVWHEHDILAVYQGLWNFVLSDRQFVDTRVSYNSINFPLNLKTTQQTLLDQATNIRTRANTVQQVMDRRRLQVSSNWQYFVPQALGGRHEIRAGFDNAYTPETVDIAINGDVRDVYRSAATSGGAAGPVQVQLFNTPLQQKRAVQQTSLYAQDSYSYKRLTVVGGVRWERVEGWLPAQQDPASQYFPEGSVLQGAGGTTYTVQRSFPEVRDVPLWHNIGPRGSFIYDLSGTGRTAVKASLARYYDTIGTGTPGTLNPNGLIQQNYTWLDNGDLVFQPGEQGTPSAPSLPPTAAQLSTRVSPNLKRPYRNEWTLGIDHELIPDLRLSATYIHRQEHDQLGNIDIGIPMSYYAPINVVDPGRDGVVGTADDGTLTVYNENTPLLSSSLQLTNIPDIAARYNGFELTATKRYSKRWTMVAGYTFGRTSQSCCTNESTNLTSPNSFVNATGKASIDRAHNFKLTGSYLLPYDIQLGGNLRFISGQPITRLYNVPGLVQAGGGTVTVNAESRGNDTLPSITTLDGRVGKIFHFGGHEFEADLDVYNLTNNNSIYTVRLTTGTVKLTNYTTGTLVTLPQYGTPVGVLGPRIARINLVYRFGQR